VSTGIYLAGGGSAEDDAAVWDSMLSGVLHILYWPAALSGSLLQDAETRLRTSSAGRPGVEITAWPDLAEHKGEVIPASGG
jgi:dipeptidase E